MLFYSHLEDVFQYFLKKESTQFFVSIAIRSLALGMVGVFESIYLYIYFGRSVSHVLLFWAAHSGIFALTAVFGGKIMAKIGLKRTMLLSNFFLFGYYICLFFFYQSFWLVPLAIIFRAIAATLFWPAFHTEFVRFSEKSHRALQVSKISVVALVAGIISPLIGGIILAGFGDIGYMVLFTVVLVTLFVSTFPLFLSKERYETYTDTYKKTWRRIFQNKNISFSLASLSIEAGIDAFLWPIFIFVLGISYQEIGGISTFALLISALFALYMGKITTKKRKGRLLNLGSVFLAMSWVMRYFVVDAFSVFLTQNFYRVSKTSALIPFRTILYDRAALEKQDADEFMVYREIIIHITRFFFFIVLAGVFFFIPKINISFFIAVIASIGFSWLARPRLFSFGKKKKN